ncbi:MAG: protein translocase subunit SecD [Candidatus Competibacteraceae bacterium]|nr:protein translocase subunit SecD [Candidatus Competibacteraceae bacterium]
MNQYPWWKYLIIAAITVIGIFYAMPNLFGEDPAVQISPARSAVLASDTYERVLRRLEVDQVPVKGHELTEDRLLVRFPDTESQLKAADLIKETLGRDYTVALNLAPSTPGWLRALGLEPMYLGLDLRGGVHFLMEVDMDAVVEQAQERYVDEVRTLLRDETVRYISVTRERGGVRVVFQEEDLRAQAENIIRAELPGLAIQNLAGSNGRPELALTLREEEIQQRRDFALKQNLTILRNRVNELGVAEPVIQQQGSERIVVQLPGVQDTARAKEILGATATLEFRMVYEGNPVTAEQEAARAVSSGRPPLGTRIYDQRNGPPILLQRRVMLTGDYITDAASGFDQQSGSPAVFVTLDSKGASRFEDATENNIGRAMAVVFIENKSETVTEGDTTRQITTTVEEVINVATIRDRLSKRFQITGLDSSTEARDLALLLRAGALAAPIRIIEERTVGPSVGQENIEQGFQSTVLAFVLVIVFMAFYYRLFGLVANVVLVVNLVLIVAVLSMLQATLTLPGIAGIVLTMGMAVDANVLIYERIREEVRLGSSPQAAIHSGYSKAFSTIADANITTLIAAVVLFGFGTGPIKGFAVTLSIGIITSMFTAIMGSRAVINWYYGGRRVERLSI